MAVKLQTLVNDQAAGELLKEQEQVVFRYHPDAQDTQFVSLTMPVRARSYDDKALPPIFEMHLPEGYLLAIIQRHFTKLVGADDLSLLNLLAPSIRGRVHYPKTDFEKKPLKLDDLLTPTNGLFAELVERFALHSPISGVQPKVLAQVQNKATLHIEDYIVKAWGAEYPQLALNEYWCMRVVQEANIPVPEFYLSEDNSLFIMKRFDIKPNGEYLGFEDMCVLQAKGREEKYEGSCEQLAKTISSFVSPQHRSNSMQQYFKMMVLNQRLQNGDAHLKNFGVLYENIKDVWLAPAYDVVSTTAYIKQDVAALTLMGSRKWWSREHLLNFAVQHCGLTLKQAGSLYEECQQAMVFVAQQIEKTLTNDLLPAQIEILEHLLKLLTSKEN